MPLSPKEQLKSQIDSAENILILTAEKPQNDAVASSWAFSRLLKNLGKNPTVLAKEADKNFASFLALPENSEKQIKGARDFVLSFDTTRNKIIDFRTENKIDKFEIYITPERETIDPRDFSFIPAHFKYDLVIVLGCQNLDCLGEMKEKNSDLFFEVPVINIDRSGANENFGQINLVDITASSVAEILSDIFKDFWEKQSDKDAAQCLLTGLVASTGNFQSRATTPKTFLAASWLIEKGANQQEIVRNLFKTQSFSFMKLWGRVMARLQWDEKMKIAWSTISLEDFVQSRTKPGELPLVLEKVRDNFSAGKFFVILFSETLGRSIALVKNSDSESLKNIQKKLGGEIKENYLEIAFENKNILEAEKELLEKLKKMGG
jgi:nanoRNase/pAp phosphatase (c-di-AMP/oligoRNAs hydrolase)